MSEEQRILLEALAKSQVTIKQMNIGDHNHIAYNNYAVGSGEKTAKKVDVETLKRCVQKVSWMFWDPCAITVVFCACFRCFGYENNMAQFERDFGCKEDLISRTLRNHPYMRLKLDEWEDNGAKDRELKLLEAFQDAVNEELAK